MTKIVVKYKATYFKESGKYYTEGEGVCEVDHYWELPAAIKKQRDEKDLPGVTGGTGFYIVVEPLEPENFQIPFMIHPLHDSQEGKRTE